MLQVSRSNLIDRLQGRNTGRPFKYDKCADEALLPSIVKVCASRASNGYRRVTARLNRLRRAANEPPVNHKRVYRIMKQNELLLPRYTGRVDERCHDGKVITLKSNMRWCSDGFEIRCWNKEVVRVAFSLDCCDREVMRYVATTGGINGQMIQDLLVESLEYRFGSSACVPQPLEWLTDNGSCYIKKETREFAKNLGFIVCTTPIRSPQSNGMAEAFVKTFKRDYVYLNDLPDAKTVMEQLVHWFEDYNETHPHKGLKMKSPREYRAQSVSAG